MVKTIYLLVLFLLVAVMLFVGRSAYRKNDRLPKSIAVLEWICAFAVFFDAIFRIAPTTFIAYLSKGMYYFGMDLLAVSLVYFALQYTQIYKYRKWSQYGLFACVAADFAFVVWNLWRHDLFWLTKDAQEYVISIQTEFLVVRLLIFNVCVLFCVVLLVYKLMNVSHFYRMKYLIVAVTVFVYDVLNALNYGWQSGFDISVIFSSIMVLIIYYFSQIYIPNGLVGRILIHANQGMKNIMIFFDVEGHCVYINDAGRKFFGLSPLQGLEAVEQEFSTKRKGDVFEELEDGEWEEEHEIDGQKHYFLGSFEKLYDENENCIAGFIMLEDRTEERERYEEQRYRATHDLLTGLINRNRFKDRVTEILNAHKYTQYLMVCTDIKDFKLVNDLFGFDTGDEVLRTQADILRTYDDELCAYSRLTSDKFALCLPRVLFDEQEFLAHMKVMHEKFNSDIFQLHVNVGVYEIQDITEAPSIMCDKAALAISSTRGNYEQTISYYNRELMDKTIRDRKMVSEFEDAIENDEFLLYLQPQFDDNQKILGCEALVRWQHPKFGLIAPNHFIDVFERAGLIHRLDAHVWELAGKKLAAWKESSNNDMYISVNISVKDFYFIDVYKTFVELVEKYEIDPARLKLEITETALMTEFSKNQTVINRLREYGFTIEIDDFGSGYSSLNMLRNIYADVVKLDMGFLGKDDVDHARSNTIIKAIITMSKELNMVVITEGVETEEQFEMLKQMGCGVFQGYFFEKPISVPAFEEKYLSNAAS